MKVKGTLLRIIQSMLLGKLDEVAGCHKVLLVLGIVLTEATLIARDEVLLLWHATSEPAMPRSGL